jgi:hypothetical protein
VHQFNFYNTAAIMEAEEQQDKPPMTASEMRRARREAALDQIFGKNRPSMWSNIWGWRVSILGFIVLVITITVAIIGTKTGAIRWDNPEDSKVFSKPSDHLRPVSKDTKKDSI